jgi:hypothetical protein
LADSGAIKRWHATVPDKEIAMDFIERLFGLSPDNGNGSTELMYFIAFVAIALVVAWF